MQLCKDFKFELLIPEAEKLRIEFEGIMLKSSAKIQKVSALDLKEQQAQNDTVEVKTLAQTQLSMTAATTTFLVSSAAAYCALIAY